MKKQAIFILVILALLLSACATNKASTQSPLPLVAPGARDTSGAGEQGVAPSAPSKGGDTYNSSTTSSNITVAQERLIQTDVTLSIVVPDVQKKMNEINQMVTAMGGYLVSMNINQIDYGSGNKYPQGTISIRVPATKLDTALAQIKTGIVGIPPVENRTGQDVTSQYVDLQSQLSNLQRAEKDLQDIMDEAKNNPGNDSTTKTQDVLNVYNQIVNIRGQIEQIQGQMKYIEETTSTSAINVTLIAEETIKPIEIGGWKPQGVARDAIQALIKFLQGFVNFLIWFVLLALPVMIVIFGPIALIVWAIIAGIKRRKAKKAKAA
jgi:hypothetical protein